MDLLLILYVDDGLICGEDDKKITALISQMKEKYETKVFEPKSFIGL